MCLAFVMAIMCAAPSRADINDILMNHIGLNKGHDFTLDYRTGSATYRIGNAFSKTFRLEMKEELSVLDEEPNPDIEMCNGTVTDETGAVGICHSQAGYFSCSSSSLSNRKDIWNH